jgi:hypothetical protein
MTAIRTIAEPLKHRRSAVAAAVAVLAVASVAVASFWAAGIEPTAPAPAAGAPAAGQGCRSAHPRFARLPRRKGQLRKPDATPLTSARRDAP